MNLSDKNLFLATFYNEPEIVKKLVGERNGNIEMKIDGWYENQYSFSAFEIAIIVADTLENLKDLTSLKSNKNFNPSEEYKRILALIEFLKPYSEKDDIVYTENYDLIYSTEEWFDEEEMTEYLQKGYRQIDLELINGIYKRDEAKIRKLLIEGASPDISPGDEDEIVTYMDRLAADDSSAFIQYVAYRKKFEPSENYKKEDISHMLRELYQTGSSSRIYRIIASFDQPSLQP